MGTLNDAAAARWRLAVGFSMAQRKYVIRARCSQQWHVQVVIYVKASEGQTLDISESGGFALSFSTPADHRKPIRWPPRCVV